MPGVREFLLRMRPAGAPGSAGAAGVPADLLGRAQDELDPVFAALAPAVREAQRARTEAREQAAAIISAAHERSRVLLAQARVDATAQRSRVATELIARAERDAVGLRDEATGEAARFLREAENRRQARTAQVVDRVREELSGLDGDPP